MGSSAAVAGRLRHFSLVVRPGDPDFLDLPWQQPLSQWRSGRLVEVAPLVSLRVQGLTWVCRPLSRPTWRTCSAPPLPSVTCWRRLDALITTGQVNTS
jgi:hypothetical protein